MIRAARRRLAAAALVALALGVIAGCDGVDPGASPNPKAVAAQQTTFRIASLKGPTTMGLVGLMDEATQTTARHDYRVTMYGTPDEVVPLVVSGQVDVAFLPSNLAAVLYNKTLTDSGAAVQVAAVTTLGVLDIVENGDTVHSIADLKGRTIYASGKGASPQYVLEHVLQASGLSPADVTVEYRSEPTEVAALVAAKPGAIGMLPQPFATAAPMQTPGVRDALSLTAEWDSVSPDSRLVMGVMVVNAAFAREHEAAFAEFLDDYARSVAFANDDPHAAAVLIAAQGIVPKAAIAEAAIPACNITDLEGDEARAALDGYLAVLMAADPASVGGKLPGDDFYYRR